MSTDETFDTPFSEVEETPAATLKARFGSLMEKIVPRGSSLRSRISARSSGSKTRRRCCSGPGSQVISAVAAGGQRVRQADAMARSSHDARPEQSGCVQLRHDRCLGSIGGTRDPMLVMHSSGTSGKLSIIPRAASKRVITSRCGSSSGWLPRRVRWGRTHIERDCPDLSGPRIGTAGTFSGQ